jgi:hypothetical protein
MTVLNDGTGKGNNAKVDGNNRLHTQSVQEAEATHAVEAGDAYNINTGNITFSAAGTLLFVKNNEDKDLVISAIAVGLGSGTLSDSAEITIERNTTGGDLGFSDNTAVDINANRNFGSSKTLDANVYKGKSGGTSTGGNDAVLLYQTASSRLFATIDIVVPKGNNIAITIDPKLSSGSVKAYAAIICHLKDPNSKD